MTLEQIEYFVASVEKGSFSAAAGQMFVSHSSVSRAVSVLENDLGVKLLIRGRRGLVCTEEGEAFYRRGKALLQQAHSLREEMEKYGRRQTLQIVSVGIYAPRFFALCRDYQQSHPSVDLIMEQTDQRTALEKLRAGSVDMGATFSYSLPADCGFQTLVLEQGSFCALVSPRHELAEREFLTSDELAARRDILGENPFHSERERRRNLPEDVQSILLQIKAGNGITVLPEHTAAEFGHGCVQVPIRGERNDYELVLAWDPERASGPLGEAIEFFRDRLGKDAFFHRF